MVVPEYIFKELLDKNMYDKYRQFLFQAYVETNKNAKWCTGKSCTRVAYLPGGGATDIKCDSCETEYCFKCMKDSH